MTVNALIHYFTKRGLAYLLPLCNSCSAGKQNTFGMIPFSCSLWVMNFSLLCESLMCVGCRRNLGSPCIPPGLGNSNPPGLGAARVDPPDQGSASAPLPDLPQAPKALSPFHQAAHSTRSGFPAGEAAKAAQRPQENLPG